MRIQRARGQKVSVAGGIKTYKGTLLIQQCLPPSEALWPIMRISHTRSRYIYDLYYKREAISKELYDWLLKQGYADAK